MIYFDDEDDSLLSSFYLEKMENFGEWLFYDLTPCYLFCICF